LTLLDLFTNFRPMKKVHKDLGALVKEYREKADLTQAQLAERLGYETPQFVSVFERGLSKIPLETLGQLITLLGIPQKTVMKALMDDYQQDLRAQIEAGKKASRRA